MGICAQKIEEKRKIPDVTKRHLIYRLYRCHTSRVGPLAFNPSRSKLPPTPRGGGPLSAKMPSNIEPGEEGRLRVHSKMEQEAIKLGRMKELLLSGMERGCVELCHELLHDCYSNGVDTTRKRNATTYVVGSAPIYSVFGKQRIKSWFGVDSSLHPNAPYRTGYARLQ